MSSQNPVFIPGPTNIPERLRHAVNVPTIDHRSADFTAIFRPLFPGVKEILKMREGEVVFKVSDQGRGIPGKKPRQNHRPIAGQCDRHRSRFDANLR